MIYYFKNSIVFLTLHFLFETFKSLDSKSNSGLVKLFEMALREISKSTNHVFSKGQYIDQNTQKSSVLKLENPGRISNLSLRVQNPQISTFFVHFLQNASLLVPQIHSDAIYTMFSDNKRVCAVLFLLLLSKVSFKFHFWHLIP